MEYGVWSMGENLLQKVLPKPLSKNFYYSFLIYGVLLHNPKLARRAREYRRNGGENPLEKGYSPYPFPKLFINFL